MNKIPILILFYPAIEGLIAALYYATDSTIFAITFPLIGGVSFLFGLSHKTVLIICSLLSICMSPFVSRVSKVNSWKLLAILIAVTIFSYSAMEMGSWYSMQKFSHAKETQRQQLKSEITKFEELITTTYTENKYPGTTGILSHIRISTTDEKIREFAGAYTLFLFSTDNNQNEHPEYEGLFVIQKNTPYIQVDESSGRKTNTLTTINKTQDGIELVVYYEYKGTGGSLKTEQFTLIFRKDNEMYYKKVFPVNLR